MATIRQIKVKDVVYDISPSPSGTLVYQSYSDDEKYQIPI